MAPIEREAMQSSLNEQPINSGTSRVLTSISELKTRGHEKKRGMQIHVTRIWSSISDLEDRVSPQNNPEVDRTSIAW